MRFDRSSGPSPPPAHLSARKCEPTPTPTIYIGNRPPRTGAELCVWARALDDRHPGLGAFDLIVRESLHLQTPSRIDNWDRGLVNFMRAIVIEHIAARAKVVRGPGYSLAD